MATHSESQLILIVQVLFDETLIKLANMSATGTGFDKPNILVAKQLYLRAVNLGDIMNLAAKALLSYSNQEMIDLTPEEKERLQAAVKTPSFGEKVLAKINGKKKKPTKPSTPTPSTFQKPDL